MVEIEALGVTSEREAGFPSSLETIETQAGNGMLRMNSRACKTGALPAELHARGPSVPTNSHDEPVFGDPGATYSKCLGIVQA